MTDAMSSQAMTARSPRRPIWEREAVDETLSRLKAGVVAQLAFCREDILPVLWHGELTPDAIRALRREELGVRLAVYRAYRKAARRS